MAKKNKIEVVSLFDTTGYAVEPFTKLGYKTLIVDILNKKDNPKATYTWNKDILTCEKELIDICTDAKLLIGFPPCTDLAASGAAHFKRKREKNPHFQEEALYLFLSVYRVGEATGIPYMIENPISVVSTMWRKPNFIFSPYEYGGYLPENDEHPDFPEYITPRDAYSKKTCLWLGNNFTLPNKKPIEFKKEIAAQFSQRPYPCDVCCYW